MGSPEFAAPTLLALVSTQHQVIAVYTKPPSYSGRGLQENKSVIHNLAEKFDISVMTPKRLRDSENIEVFRSFAPDIVVVAAYGLIIPKEFLQIPKYGFINVHPSDLPRWRGAAPIQRTIMAGDTKTAICIMQMDEGVDTGDIILRKEILLDDQITAKELHDMCAETGGKMVLETLSLIEQKKVLHKKQSDIGVTYAEKIQSNEEKIDFNLGAIEINCKIRTLSPRPGAYFFYNNEIIKIIKAQVVDLKHDFEPGMVIDDNLSIACKEGVIKPILLQRQGKKMIYTDAFLRGFNIPAGNKVQK
ncbi:Methionyl-tRNA formyltransferase [Candidatus Bandiella woodruffii]|uniref:Methionyl-tRNA formyltransferase n=2 Tax=Candidatus Bandiella euplotis TaxID=1664265 RepID=A0ABZ0UM40_9RICK|nr:Methionyl-tRNA formyltransferase [Candidatus Bandiella woodruffii]